MNMTSSLCDTIYGKRNSQWEVNADNFRSKVRGGFRHELILKQAIKNRKISSHQAHWVSIVWKNTLVNSISNWSETVASCIEIYTKKINKPIIVERYSNHRLSGRIYYDFNTEQDIHDFAKVVFEGTSLFKNRECGRKTNKKINPLDINKDIDIIKAIVYGLFTRPRMCCSVKVHINDGAITENKPRCISEDMLRKLQMEEIQKNKQQAELIRARAEYVKAKAVQRQKFVLWAHSFIEHVAEEKRISNSLAEMEGADDWETAWD